jgi:hypothetical protein
VFRLPVIDRLRRAGLSRAWLCVACVPATTQDPGPMKPVPAPAPQPVAPAEQRYAKVIEALLETWQTADLVCLGENHGRQRDSELRIALVRHRAFPRIVRLIVVESANPIHQDLLDRFILEGAELSREELAPVWRDASGAEVWECPIYEDFLRAVRDVNRQLPPEQRVRVIGGDSPIDWSRIETGKDLAPLINRGGNIRTIIGEQILDKHVKALAIYGAGHCTKIGGGFPGELAAKYGQERMWCVWPLGLGDQPAYLVVTGTKWAATRTRGMESIDPDLTVGEVVDAFVYHGDVPDVAVPADLSTLKEKLGAELDRRARLIPEALELWRRKP